MKPLPLLLTLLGVALIGALVLTLRKPSEDQLSSSQLSPIPDAPLPIDFQEPEFPLPQPPILEENLTPDPQLVSFVEGHLGLTFSKPPIFTPTPAEDIIGPIELGIADHLTHKQLTELNLVCHRLKLLPAFQQIDHNAVTILAGEVRGLITPTRNLVLNDLQPSSPPEQAALVNLLAQRLLTQEIPFPKKSASIDQILARHFTVQSLSFAAEKEFRKTLPEYPASLNENLRESILLGLPAFFHELSTFSEFHLWKKLQASTPSQAIAQLSTISSTPSRDLLAFPFATEPSNESSHLGAIPLYLILLEATDPTTASTLATALIGDSIELNEDLLTWTLTFSSEKSVPRAAEFFRSYFSLRDSERKIKITVDSNQLLIQSR
ncbi:MAG: hypothetical protein ACSHYB_07160 [Roseibacillus sp.]